MPRVDVAPELETIRALFDGHRLTQARQLAGELKADLASDVGVTAAAIGQFENGTARPSAVTLAKLSLALGVPATFFAANRPRFTVSEDEAHFRSLRSTSSRDRAQARAQVELLAEVVEVLERRVRLPAVDLPALDPATSPEDAARVVREAWDLGEGPISDVVGLLERRGVIVSRLPAATDELDAASCWVGERPFVVLVANKEAADRARFDGAHELAHLVLRHDAQPGDPEIERIAHRFAAEFLTPASSITRELPHRADWRRLADLKLRWGVSMAMLLRRMRDLAVISDAAYRRGMMDLGRRGWCRVEPVGIGMPEQPELLAHAVELLGRLRSYTLDDLAGDLALRRENLEPFIEALTATSRAQLTLSP